MKGAFDENRLRFDYGEPAYVVAPEKIAEQIRDGIEKELTREEWLAREGAEPDKKDVVLANVETFFIRTPEKVAYWFNGQPTVFLLAANEDVPQAVRFDIKALGLYGWLEFKQGLEVDELLAAYRKNEKFEVEDLGNGLWRLSFLFDGGRLTSSRWEIDINVSQGFTPVQSKLKERNKLTGKTSVTQASQVTWKQVNGAWVPDKYHIQEQHERSNTYTSIDLTFSFDRVNEELDESLFTYESFPTPDYAAVIDGSGAKPVFVRRPFEGLGQKQMPPLPANRSRLVIILANVLAVGSILLFVLWRWRKARSERV